MKVFDNMMLKGIYGSTCRKDVGENWTMNNLIIYASIRFY